MIIYSVSRVVSDFVLQRGSVKELSYRHGSAQTSSAVSALSVATLSCYEFLTDVYNRICNDCAGSESMRTIDELCRHDSFLPIVSLAEILVGEGIPKRLAKALPVCGRQLFQAWKAILPAIKESTIAVLAERELPPPARITLSERERWTVTPAEVRDELIQSWTCPRYIVYRPLRPAKPAAEQLAEAGVTMMPYDDLIKAFDAYREAVQQHGPTPTAEFFASTTIAADPIVPNVYMTPQSFSLPTALGRDFAFMDRGSAIAPTVLAAPAGARVAEYCAAPGGKTLVAASHVGVQGVLLAVELDPRRADTIKFRAKAAGAVVRVEEDGGRPARRDLDHEGLAPVIIVRTGSCLDVPPQQLEGVTHIMVDPSCSSSGMAHNLDRVLAAACERTGGKARAREHASPEQMAGFQIRALRAGLSAPDARRVVYSTCSVHVAENEAVVARALAAHRNFRLVHALPEWPSRGLAEGGLTEAQGRCCLRAGENTRSSGIFVAVFERC